MNPSLLVYEFHLNITYVECESLYQASIRHAIMTDVVGRRVQIPLEKLKKFVTRSGVKGIFILKTTKNNRFLSFERKPPSQ